MLDPAQFRPFSKNPPIAKVFREVSLADELGSGMRNTYKYTKLYSGGEPQFIEGDLFRTIIPLKPIVTAKVGPGVSDHDSDQVSDHDVAAFDFGIARMPSVPAAESFGSLLQRM